MPVFVGNLCVRLMVISVRVCVNMNLAIRVGMSVDVNPLPNKAVKDVCAQQDQHHSNCKFQQ